MKKKNIVEQVIGIQEQMNTLTQDRVNEIAPKAELAELPISIKERAKLEGAYYIEPNKKMPPFGKLDSKHQKERDRDWEYVCGIFQPDATGGYGATESKKFWFCKWAGDSDCLWEIPLNVKCYVPRMIAVHLSGEKQSTGMEAMKFHKFDYKMKSKIENIFGEHTHGFSPIATHYTGRFVPLGAF